MMNLSTIQEIANEVSFQTKCEWNDNFNGLTIDYVNSEIDLELDVLGFEVQDIAMMRTLVRKYLSPEIKEAINPPCRMTASGSYSYDPNKWV